MKRLTILTALIFNSIVGNTQDNSIQINKIDIRIEFDGVIDEADWTLARSLPLQQQSPNFGDLATEETDFKILYDDGFIYVGVKNYSKNPENIWEFSKERDGSGPMDWIGFAFDGYNDLSSGLAFATSPAGNRWEETILVNSNGISLDTNWNSYWEVKTTKDQNGWYAEFKIPISSLRFRSTFGSETEMKFIAWRKIAYKNEFTVFPNFNPDWGIMSFANISMGAPIVFKELKSHKPVYFTPYALGGISNDKIINIAETKYVDNVKSFFDVGLDFKYNLSPQLTLDATVNTDFAQVEVDNFQVNLSRSSIYFPEKREFLLEKIENFKFRFDNNNDAFYSRRIGLNDDGEIETIYAGLKLSGKLKNWDLGLMSMQLEDSETESSKNLAVFRVKQQINHSNSYYGGILTSNIGKNGSWSRTYGFDSQIEFSKNNYFKMALAKFESTDQKEKLFSSDNLRYNFKLQNSNEKGFNYMLSHSLIGEQYNPNLGFEERQNILNYKSLIGYGFFPNDNKNVFKYSIEAGFSSYYSYSTKEKESLISFLEYGVDWKNGSTLGILASYNEEFLSAPLYLNSDTFIPVGDYYFRTLDFVYGMATNKPLNAKVAYTYGEYYNGIQNTLNLNGQWDGGKTLQLMFNYGYDNINLEENNFINHLVSLSSLFTFTTKYSLSSLVQYDKDSNKISANLRFRYNPREGNDLFFVITNINNTNRYREQPSLPSVQSWQFVLKYRYTFTF